MQAMPDKENESVNLVSNEALIEKFLSTTDEEKEINSSIVKREFEKLTTYRFKPFFDDYSDFKTFINNGYSDKLLFLLMALVGFGNGIWQIFNFTSFINMLFIWSGSSFFTLTVCAILDNFNLFKRKNIFKNLGLDLKLAKTSLKEKVKVVSAISVFLNNDWKEFEENYKKEKMTSILKAIDDGEVGKANMILNSIFVDFYKSEAFAKKMKVDKYPNIKSFEDALKNNSEFPTIQAKFLGSSAVTPIVASPNESLYEALTKNAIPERDVESFIKSFNKVMNSNVGMKISRLLNHNFWGVCCISTGVLFTLFVKFFCDFLLSQSLINSDYRLSAFFFCMLVSFTPLVYFALKWKKLNNTLNKFYFNVTSHSEKDVLSALSVMSIFLNYKESGYTDSEKKETLNQFIEDYYKNENKAIDVFWTVARKVSEKFEDNTKEFKANDLFLMKDVDVISSEVKKNLFFDSK